MKGPCGPVSNDSYSPIRGKCVWWREVPHADDTFDSRLKDSEKRVECSCFVEGFGWVFETKDVPAECPNHRACRYYVSGR
jgi:hypothetical protein